MDLGLSGRRALVCGSSRGLGFACANALVAEGVAVTLVSRSSTALADAAGRIEQATGMRPSVVAADVATPRGRELMMAEAPQRDILVTNAGGPPSKDFRDVSLSDWQASLDANFLSAAELIRMTTDGMIERGFGRIVNVTSLTVRMPVERLDLSNATRLALTGYVAGIACQVARNNVTINNLLPGTIATERILELGETAQKLIDKVPAGRAGTPEEFGAACAFLCSTQAAYITGQNLLLDGGLCPFAV
jgi:3-oxoacyl-[acyl-carrier protein] reductase